MPTNVISPYSPKLPNHTEKQDKTLHNTIKKKSICIRVQYKQNATGFCTTLVVTFQMLVIMLDKQFPQNASLRIALLLNNTLYILYRL